MAGEDRTTSDPVALFNSLHDEPYRFGFYNVLRLIEAHYRDKPRVGESSRTGEDPVRFGQEPSLAFAPSTLGGSSAPVADSLPG
jgi:type VI secretion system protein ImpH